MTDKAKNNAPASTQTEELHQGDSVTPEIVNSVMPKIEPAQIVKVVELGPLAKYKTPGQLRERVDEYFESGVRTRKVIVGKKGEKKEKLIQIPTVAGLALFLGFDDRQSVYDYSARPAFSCVIKRAVTYIEMYHEESLSDGNNVVGSIFWLKNHQWKDKSEVEHSAKDSIAELMRSADARQIESKETPLTIA